MPLLCKNGKVVAVWDGATCKLACDIDLCDCLCEGGALCDSLPSTLYAHTTFCGESVITLNEQTPNTIPGIAGVVYGERHWYGTGLFGNGPGTMKIALACTSNEGLYICIDGCAGTFGCTGDISSWGGVLTDFQWTSPYGTYGGVPLSACDPTCFDDFLISIEDAP